MAFERFSVLFVTLFFDFFEAIDIFYNVCIAFVIICSFFPRFLFFFPSVSWPCFLFVIFRLCNHNLAALASPR